MLLRMMLFGDGRELRKLAASRYLVSFYFLGCRQKNDIEDIVSPSLRLISVEFLRRKACILWVFSSLIDVSSVRNTTFRMLIALWNSRRGVERSVICHFDEVFGVNVEHLELKAAILRLQVCFGETHIPAPCIAR